MVALRREAAMGLKEEYHAFRNTAAAIMLAAPAALLWGMRHGLRDDGCELGRVHAVCSSFMLWIGLRCSHWLMSASL